jgi:serine/threonine protein kinase/tetratricopeptide (TPR) repeat protein
MRTALPDRVRLGVFEVDLRAGELREGDRSVILQEQALRILRMLLEAEGALVAREEIRQTLWPNDTVVEFDHSINTAMKKLRQALGDSPEDPKYIETIPRRGYRLLVRVERLETPSDASNSDEPESSPRPEPPHVVPPVPESANGNGNLIGKKVSHYRVLEVLGGGGMGMLYRAEDLKLGRQVALKFLPEEMAWDTLALKRFEREARTASSLDHHNICTVYEVEEHEDRPFIVMQLLKGETLRDRLATLAARQEKLPLDELLNIAVQVCDGLQAAHAGGIIHRDIKPANIFLTSSGQAKILDFGLAKPVSSAHDAGSDGLQLDGSGIAVAAQPARTAPADTTLTRLGVAVGTAGYMSPEQVRGEKLDARTDIFSFGLVLYEMATGQRAFSGETAVDVHEAILNQTPTSVRERNSTIPPELETIINRAVEKNREQRYQTAAEMGSALKTLADRPVESESGRSRIPARWQWLAAAVALIAVAGIAVGLYRRSHRAPKLTEQDTIVIADFENKTGDPVFDDTLQQALSIQLQQSPFVNVLSDRKVRATLKLMNRSGESLTEDVAREICVRTGSKAMLVGSLATSSPGYVIDLKAMDCGGNQAIAEIRQQVTDKQSVLPALDKATKQLRSRLGESLGSIDKYAAPLQEATTPSLDALRAYSLGWKTHRTKGGPAAIPFYQRAVELDPNFAIAYNQLAVTYRNTFDFDRMEEYASKAYQLRERVSERERFAIEAFYYHYATGELPKAAQIYQLWQQRYPRDSKPFSGLGAIYCNLGDMEKYLEQTQAVMGLEPDFFLSYVNLASAYENLNRIDEADQVLKQAEQHHLTEHPLLIDRYELAFLKGDRAEMAELVAALKKMSGLDHELFASLADTEAWYGKYKNARELGKQAIESAQRDGDNERAAFYLATQALSRMPAGNRQQSRADALAALKLSQSLNIKAVSALALARAGDVAAARTLAAELDNKYPLSTAVQQYWLPTIEAAIALEAGQDQRALDLLKKTASIELGALVPVAYLCPAYIRGEAYLMMGNGKAAGIEFHKFIEHYGAVGLFSWGALARLELARAYALEAQSDPAYREKARTAYQNFLTLWKDADPDILIYKQAKAEYAKLQ